jgi:hypothetical protein
MFIQHLAHGTIDQIPPTSVHASAWLNDANRLQITGWEQHLVPTDEPDPITFADARTQLSAEAQWVVE